MVSNKGKGKIVTRKSGGGKYKSTWIYVPKKLRENISFPFVENDELNIEIENGKLIISKLNKVIESIRNYGIENATISYLLESKAKENGDKTFLCFEDEKISYRELNDNSNRIANGLLNFLRQNKLKKPHVALMFPNCPEFFYIWFGISKVGCTFVPINYMSDDATLEYLLSNSKSDVLIIHHDLFHKFQKISENPRS